VTLVVRGTDDTGTSVGDSSPFHMQFSKDNVDGALYYWTTTGSSAIMRWDFSGSTQSAQAYLTPANTKVTSCIGCHALAPDGSKMVVSANGQGDGRLLLWDIANNKALVPYPLAQRSQFESWNSDGTQFVGVFGDNQNTRTYAKAGPVDLTIFDGLTGAMTATIALGGARGDHPDWSKSTDAPNTIVFTSADPTAPTTDQHPGMGGIDYVQYDGTAWGAPQTLVPAVLGKNRYYPAIGPDGDLVVYDESTCTAGTPTAGMAPDVSCDADTDATATMYLTSLSSGGANPILLNNANRPGIADNATTALTNSFPKWSPFVSNLNEMDKLVWLTFSSTRQYGLRPPPASSMNSSEAKTGTLIWMVGVNLGVGSQDPSYTAFALPFQDITTSNHIAQWAKFFINPG
jgi:Tol biopolymer transport system component